MNTKFREYELKDYESIKKFIKGGLAIFTIRNEKTGNRFTYKFKRNDKNPSVYWVYMLCMAQEDDTKNYKFLGGFSEEKKFINSPKAQIKNTIGVKAIDWFCRHLYKEDFPPELKIYHLSHCGRCGRPLTTPDSIISGFGPDCMKKEIMGGNTQPVKNLEQFTQDYEQFQENLKQKVINEVGIPNEKLVLKEYQNKAIDDLTQSAGKTLLLPNNLGKSEPESARNAKNGDKKNIFQRSVQLTLDLFK